VTAPESDRSVRRRHRRCPADSLSCGAPANRPAPRRSSGSRAGAMATSTASAPPDQARRGYEVAERGLEGGGRSRGVPRFVVGMYYALGTDAAERAPGTFATICVPGPNGRRLRSIAASTPDAVRAAFEAYVAVGVDEVIAWPTIAELGPGRAARRRRCQVRPRTTIKDAEASTRAVSSRLNVRDRSVRSSELAIRNESVPGLVFD